MPSSTSSFDRAQPNMPWKRVWGATLIVFILFIIFMETRLAQLGYQPTPLNADVRWAHERARASELGKRALILVGQSRILLDLDLDTLRKTTGLEPVQLAVDANPPYDILLGLAADPSIQGTVLVDYYDYTIGISGEVSTRYQKYYEKHGHETPWEAPSIWMENQLSEFLHSHFLSFADDANPYDSLTSRIMEAKVARHLLTTRPDRSVLADFSQVPMPEHYYKTVAGGLGLTLEKSGIDPRIQLERKIQTLNAVSDIPGINDLFTQKVNEMKVVVKDIQAHGARVMFAAMPTSGFVRQIEDRQFPKAYFWDRFVQLIDARAIRSNGNPKFERFYCPDGSHLDLRDRQRFTELLVGELGLNSPSAKPR